MKNKQIFFYRKFHNSYLEKNDGITLISIIVMIVVLLILSGITIASLGGDNGIINEAQEAKKTVNNSSIKEQIEIAVLYAKQNKKAIINESVLKNWLTKSFGAEGTGYTITGNNSTGWEIEIQDIIYTISSEGIVEQSEE